MPAIPEYRSAGALVTVMRVARCILVSMLFLTASATTTVGRGNGGAGFARAYKCTLRSQDPDTVLVRVKRDSGLMGAACAVRLTIDG